ncbi:oligosaccharide repeat unit polymerase [Winogradskyella wandonensis]|uniref:Oligosaccharide repeat unit polymerase n=1 Tax=Winogradskyella wandonensis TaxID=1442586 RepID=A0A4R1KRW8_9FLAO|nr:O-antigen polymerase [Winogradskyella wandonensis]TCK67796.1 oligosaccharide repeat unit polymerase [Winogradskyella wandonensis]
MKINRLAKILFVAILVFLSYVVFNNNGIRYNLSYLFTSFLIIVVSLVGIFSSKSRPFSLNIMFHLFNLFFIGIAPAIQFKEDITFMGIENKLSDSDYLAGNILFLIAILTYVLIYHIKAKKYYTQNIIVSQLKPNPQKDYGKLVLIASILILIIIYWSFNFNIKFFLSREMLINGQSNFSSHVFMIINQLRILPLVFFLFYKFSGKKIFKIEISLLVIILLLNFPTAIPRYSLGVIYLPILLVYFRIFYRKYIFSIVFIISFLTVFPYLHHFRYNTKLLPENVFQLNMFKEAHFDSYQNSVQAITNSVNTGGEQLFCTIFFFVPRSIWEDKCTGSGHLLASKLNYDGFSNVAISFLGEGYINFGYIGMGVFLIFLALSFSYLDSRFWYFKNTSLFKIIYLVSIPFVFYILRGGLLSSYAYYISFVFLIFTVSLFLKIYFNKHLK